MRASLLFALFFCVLQLPLWVVRDDHDPSAEAALEYWTLHHFQYGKEVIQNVGPLGFIDYPQLYTGFLDTEKFVLNIFLTLLYLVLITNLSMRLPRIVRPVLLLNTALFSSTWLWNVYCRSADIKHYLLMLAIAYTLFITDSLWMSAGLIAVLALLSLVKGTFLFITILIVSAAMLHAIGRRKYLPILLMPVVYIASMVLFWTACGQHLQNLPVFLANMLGFTDGYANGYLDSMFVFENPFETIVGVTVFLLAIYAIASKNLWRARKESISIASWLPLAAIEYFILFIVWKHAFVRANLHLVIFFYFLTIALPLFFWLSPFSVSPVRANILERNAIPHAIGILLCYTIIFAALYPAPGASPYPNAPQVVENLAIITSIRDYFPQKQQDLQAFITRIQLPHVEKLVGQYDIGYFGFQPAPMIYNHFRYRFMPNTISFSAWSHFNIENDAKFFRDDASAPLFLLYTQKTIDKRLSAQDDPLAQLEILERYNPVLDDAIAAETKERILLERRPHLPDLTYEPRGVEEHVALNTWIDVPGATAFPLRVKMHLQNNALSSLFRLIYKPSEYAIDYVLSDGTQYSRKFMARMAEDGFLIAPFIDDNQQFLAAFIDSEYRKYLSGTSHSLLRMIKFRIRCKRLLIACANDMTVSFEAIHGLELGRIYNASAALR